MKMAGLFPGYADAIINLMFQDFKHHLINNCKIDPEKKVVLGFSGGPDSLCLLHLLHTNGFHVVVGHLDHGLRANSSVEAAHAQSVCQALGVECVVKKENVTAHARQNHLTLEESSRILRYEFLFEEVVRHDAQAVLVAHNADDQVETVLMHLMRGSGISGLAGMRTILLPNSWSNSIPLVRPLIGVSRGEIESYLLKWALEPVVDETNTDPKYFRNRIRHELIPYLATYNSRIKERVLRMADVATIEDDFLRESLDETWIKVIKLEGDNFLVIDRGRLLSMHTAIIRRFFRRSIEWMDETIRDIDFEVINRATNFCQQPTRSNRIDLLAGIEMFLYAEDLVIGKNGDPLNALWPQLTDCEGSEVPLPGELTISPQWVLEATKQKTYEQLSSPFIAQLDGEKLQGRLTIGCVRQGERFVPLGFDQQSIKVGDFWTNEGLPARVRKCWPVIRFGKEIVWIPGFRIAQPVRVENSTTEIIRLEMKKKNR